MTQHNDTQHPAAERIRSEFDLRVEATMRELQSGRSVTAQASRVRVAQAARSRGIEALAVLVTLMKDNDPSVRIRAAEAVLERGYGKPRPNEGDPNLDEMSREKRVDALRVALAEEEELLRSEQGEAERARGRIAGMVEGA